MQKCISAGHAVVPVIHTVYNETCRAPQQYVQCAKANAVLIFPGDSDPDSSTAEALFLQKPLFPLNRLSYLTWGQRLKKPTSRPYPPADLGSTTAGPGPNPCMNPGSSETEAGSGGVRFCVGESRITPLPHGCRQTALWLLLYYPDYIRKEWEAAFFLP